MKRLIKFISWLFLGRFFGFLQSINGVFTVYCYRPETVKQMELRVNVYVKIVFISFCWTIKNNERQTLIWACKEIDKLNFTSAQFYLCCRFWRIDFAVVSTVATANININCVMLLSKFLRYACIFYKQTNKVDLVHNNGSNFHIIGLV